MDFDPSQFLSMDMTEDNNAIYTTPGLSEHMTMSVEGGLEMEESLHIPVPVFGSLTNNISEDCMLEPQVEINEAIQTSTAPQNQLALVNRTSSPVSAGKKVIPVSVEETNFRRHFFNGNFDRVKLFRLHCTICDTHLGCAPHLNERIMRRHKVLSVPVCRKCFDFYGDINFPIEDDSEIYCCWCGQGGEVFCCSACPKTVCKKCIRRNFGESKIKEIDVNDNWKCYVCDVTDIWPHRALFYGLIRFGRDMRQKFAKLPKEEKVKQLSKDSSHCCSGIHYEIALSHKSIMSKIPICLIAQPHRSAVINQPVLLRPSLPGVAVTPNNNNISMLRYQNVVYNNGKPIQITTVNRMATAVQRPANRSQTPNATNCVVRPSQTHSKSAINRFAPYQVARSINAQKTVSNPCNNKPQRQVPNSSVQTTEIIDLVDEPSTDTPQPNRNEVNVAWLEKGVKDIKNTLRTIDKVIEQYETSKNVFKSDFTKISPFVDQLSERIKIGICSLAKINQEIKDGLNIATDEQVKVVVNNITAGNVNFFERNPVTSTPISHNPSVPTSSVEDDMSSLTAALLCETVLEGEGNKENQNGNKHTSAPAIRTTPKPCSSKKGKSLLSNLRKKIDGKSHQTQESIPIIDLSDDDEFNATDYLKKYNIRPCSIVLKRC